MLQFNHSSLVFPEMQRVGYDFPVERSFCYGADLLVRQYDVAREGQGKNFSYRSIKPVYVIVLMDESPGIFHGYPGNYIHRSEFSFDTGLKMKPLQNFIYISLDIFRRMEHNIVNFRFHPKELISMYSEALRIMDQNTVKYMIDELKAALYSESDESLISCQTF